MLSVIEAVAINLKIAFVSEARFEYGHYVDFYILLSGYPTLAVNYRPLLLSQRRQGLVDRALWSPHSE